MPACVHRGHPEMTRLPFRWIDDGPRVVSSVARIL
jgi:hypothetical protein